MFQFKNYQSEDLTRAAMHDGAIIAWDPGLGKTIAMFTWPILKSSRRTLIVAPASLHEQIIKEGRDKFHVTVTPILDQDHARKLINAGTLTHRIDSTPPSSLESIRPASCVLPSFFITDYRWLGYNGADYCTTVNKDDAESDADPNEPTAKYFPDPKNPIHALRLHTSAKLWDKEFSPSDFYNVGASTKFSNDDPDAEPHKITCIHRPTLAIMLRDAFDCVVCDEAVRLKAGISHNAAGVLTLRSRYRLALTGTPIKNKLHDLFFLASWTTGHHHLPTARWPYASTMTSRAEFAATHSILEENHTRSYHSGRRQIKATNQLCQLHRLWKLLAPVVVRRKKTEVGADIVAKNIIPISIQPGTQQQAAYSDICFHPTEHTTILATIGCQLADLRQAATCPHSPSIHRRVPCSVHTPKMHAILNLIADLMSTGEQVAIFSPFQEFSTALHTLLRDAKIPHALLDGRTAPLKRGKVAAAFKRKEYPVLIAGMDSMGEGHSFDQCAHLILPSITWAYDTNAQAIERVHRLTSTRPVNIYTFITKNTIDEKLQAIFTEKSNSSDLALDGRIGHKKTHDVDLAELLSSAIDSFDADAETICESNLERTWPTLAARLYQAHHTSSSSAITSEPEILTPLTTHPDIPTITATAALLNQQLTSGSITPEDYTTCVSGLMDILIDHHHLTPQETATILTTTAEPETTYPAALPALPAPPPTSQPETETTSEKHGKRLSHFKQGDKVYRNYQRKHCEYQIIAIKRDIYILRDSHGKESSWNAENNGGFILCTATPAPASESKQAPTLITAHSSLTTLIPITTRFPFKPKTLQPA